MKRITIESPFAADPTKGIYLKWCILDCLLRGESPYASHGFFTAVLDDTIKDHRELGIAAGNEWARMSDVRAFYVDLGESPGMAYARKDALLWHQQIEIRRLPPLMLAAALVGIEPGPKCLTADYTVPNREAL